MKNIHRHFFLIWIVLVSWMHNSWGQQVADETFNYPISAPLYETAGGPLIVFDEAHNNASTLRGAYAGFGKLLASDGYKIVSSNEQVTFDVLTKAKIYVTVNAMYDMEEWDLPARSAFSQNEINELSNWVNAGGSLFLITDHMPCGAAVSELAGRFGINIINGFAIRTDDQPEVFSKDKHTLLSNEITSPQGKEIDSIMCWGGTGFIVPPQATVISVLGEGYRIYLPSTVSRFKKRLSNTIPYISGRGLVNGAYLRFGRGKIVVFSDGAPFSAQLQGIKSAKRGMNHPGAMQNAPFLLNIVHWLDGKL